MTVRPGRPEDPDVPAASRVYRFAAGVAFGLMKLQGWQFHVNGLEHVPRLGGAVVAANHTSFWDFFTVGRPSYYEYGRPIRILAKESLFRTPLFGRIMQRAEHIPVHRQSGRDALESAVEAVEAGELILVLPEQTISPAFTLRPFKTGAARIAARAGAPLIPAVSWGSHRFHSVGRLPRPCWRLPVVIRYGDPLYPTTDDDPEEVTAALRRRVADEFDLAIRTYPDGAPPGAWWVPRSYGGGAPAPDEAEESIREVTRRFERGA